jgi:hypothetical protein
MLIIFLKRHIVLRLKPDKSIVITGSDDSGVFYGMQSLMALLPSGMFSMGSSQNLFYLK